MITEEKKKVLALFAEGLRHYKMMEFVEAQACFNSALTVDPSDGPSKTYLKRCAVYIEAPPGDDWDGVWTMETK